MISMMCAKPINANVKLAVWWMALVLLYAAVALHLSFFVSTLTRANIDWQRTFVVSNSPSQPLVTFHNPLAALWASDAAHLWLPMFSLMAAIALICYLHLKISIGAGDRNRLQSLKGRPTAPEGKTYLEMKEEHLRLGELLRASDVITDEQLRQALELSNKTQRFLAECFVSFAWITVEQLADAQQVLEKIEKEHMSPAQAKSILLAQKIMHDARKSELLARKQAEAEQDDIDHYSVAVAKLKPNPVSIPVTSGVLPRPEEPALWTLEASEQSKRCLQMAIESGENEIGCQREQAFQYSPGFNYQTDYPCLPSDKSETESEFGLAWEQAQTPSTIPDSPPPFRPFVFLPEEPAVKDKTAKQPGKRARKKLRQNK